MQQIPIIDANASITEVVLDGATYFLRLVWNSEDAYWSWGLESANRRTLVIGQKIVPDYPLLKWARRTGFPPGELIAVAPDRRNTVSRSDLPGGDVQLIYIPEAEL